MRQREAALAVERAHNHLWWAVCFARVLAALRLLDQVYRIASALANSLQDIEPLLTNWIRGQSGTLSILSLKRRSAITALQRIADEIESLRKRIEHDRLLGLRTQGIGVLRADRIKQAGVSGPVLQASEHGKGDVQSRLLARLEGATRDLRAAAGTLALVDKRIESPDLSKVPKGEVLVTVEGPRGRIGLHLYSEGGDGPVHVEWQRPSAALLALVPEVLPGETLADAEAIVASLDLAMAEADG
jgi:NADH:ubiquinone oxidoreductase subunit D